ncbi:polypeptide HsdS [Neiella marina]|uniref:Polypeptide HsdS n=1 Tax=Neiella marina TaxID=508461 RepID=A0A8J2U4P5_9GAMM|nr:restriction endonuclease subunit S [Neiella marina]GGA75316.1 polypeptide HsdS [Neiella marina]
MSWERVPFESLYAIPSKNGLTRPARVRGSGIKMINMGELFAHDRIGTIDMELVPMNEKELETMLVDEGDLLFARQSLVLSGAGKCSIVKTVSEETTFESHIIRVRLRKDIAYPNFFFYYFKSPQCGITSIVTQGVQAGIRGNDLKKLPVALPPMDEQIKIADVLTNYDDLIENNRRRIELLEESARLLYQEWFVHLRFPGHEQAKIVDGVPDGWSRLSVAECCEKPKYGYTASANHEAVGPKFLRITDIVPSSINWSNVPFCETGEATTKKYQLKEGDIVVARTGATVGYAKRIPALRGPVIYASYLVKFSADNSIIDDLLLGIFMESENYKDYVRSNAGGAAQPNANAQVLGGAKLLVPSQCLQKEFRDVVSPLISQKFLLEQQCASLAKARDLLLPKLMSGELEV